MASYTTMRKKLIRVLKEVPDNQKDEKVPGMNMTWWELASYVITKRKKRSRLRRSMGLPGRSRVRKVLEQAAAAGVIKLRHEEIK